MMGGLDGTMVGTATDWTGLDWIGSGWVRLVWIGFGFDVDDLAWEGGRR